MWIGRKVRIFLISILYFFFVQRFFIDVNFKALGFTFRAPVFYRNPNFSPFRMIFRGYVLGLVFFVDFSSSHLAGCLNFLAFSHSLGGFFGFCCPKR